MAATAAAPGISAWVMLPADAPARRRAAIWLFRRVYGDDWRGVVEQIDQALATALTPPQARAGRNAAPSIPNAKKAARFTRGFLATRQSQSAQ